MPDARSRRESAAARRARNVTNARNETVHHTPKQYPARTRRSAASLRLELEARAQYRAARIMVMRGKAAALKDSMVGPKRVSFNARGGSTAPRPSEVNPADAYAEEKAMNKMLRALSAKGAPRLARKPSVPSSVPNKIAKPPPRQRIRLKATQIASNIKPLDPSLRKTMAKDLRQIGGRLARELSGTLEGSMQSAMSVRIVELGDGDFNVVIGNSDTAFALRLTGTGTRRVQQTSGKETRTPYIILPRFERAEGPKMGNKKLKGNPFRTQGHITSSELATFKSELAAGTLHPIPLHLSTPLASSYTPSVAKQYMKGGSGAAHEAQNKYTASIMNKSGSYKKHKVSFAVGGEDGTSERTIKSFSGRYKPTTARYWVENHPGSAPNQPLRDVWLSWAKGDKMSKAAKKMVDSEGSVWGAFMRAFATDLVVQGSE